MTQIGIYELKTHASAIAQRVQQGESFAITLHGKEIGIFSPLTREHQFAVRKRAIQAVAAARKARGVQPLGTAGIIAAIHEGRRS
jgi:antitoxin (DNA-binding transcriptional repressor) of toxin-antitoxin stability system